MSEIMSLRVIETPTDESFFPQGYLDRNPDLSARKAERSSFDERSHFERHGKPEGRTQFTREFYSERNEFNRRRFAIFRDVLDTRFVHLEKVGQLPVATTTSPLSLDNYDGESSHGLMTYMARDLRMNPDKIYMDLGCGFQSEMHLNCLYVEVYPSRTSDVIIDPTDKLPFKSGSFDGVSCAAVLEHVRRPWEVVKEINRVLRPGGKAYIDWPFLQPFHGYPSHFYNATSEGLKVLFEDNGFSDLRLSRHPGQGADATVHWVMRWFLEGITDPKIRDQIGRMPVLELLQNPVGSALMKEVLSNFDSRMSDNLACGNCLIGTKVA